MTSRIYQLRVNRDLLLKAGSIKSIEPPLEAVMRPATGSKGGRPALLSVDKAVELVNSGKGPKEAAAEAGVNYNALMYRLRIARHGARDRSKEGQ